MNRGALVALGVAGALFIVGGVMTAAPWKQSENAKRYLPTLNAVEDANGIPRDLLARMAYQESRFREDIISGATVSSAGARGIMQMIPRFFPGVDLTDPIASIQVAGTYLRQLYDRFGSWKLAVAAYNAGPGNVQQHGGIPPFAETQNYVAQVFADVGAGIA
jgi:soluble lytic murein transglycosylase-like protein